MPAVLDRINETKAYHIITIEDPVEFMDRHKRSIIIHQRELHSDTRAGTIERDTDLDYATNPGNLRLQIADIADEPPPRGSKTTAPPSADGEPALVIE